MNGFVRLVSVIINQIPSVCSILWLACASPSLSAGIGLCNVHIPPSRYFFHGNDACPKCVAKDVLPKEKHFTTWNKASFALFKKLATQPENHVLSPHSIFEGASLLASGAGGDTVTSAFKIMGAEPDDYEALRGMMNVRTEHPEEKFARYNLITVARRHALTDKYRDFVKTQDEHLEIREDVNFTDWGAIQQLATEVNDTVCRVTDGMIDSCLDPSELRKLNPAIMATNVTAFQGKWDVDFAPARQAFHRLDNSASRIPFIEADSKKIGYNQAQGWQGVSIPYQGNFEMVAILPPLNTPPSSITEEIFSALQDLKPQPHAATGIKVVMPEHLFSMEYELKDHFSTEAPGDMFSASADFSEMLGKSGVHISSMKHKAMIRTDREGTRAAAFTLFIGRESASLSKTVEFDHPFLFMIRDKKQKVIRFIGQVCAPGNDR